jgi:hypothetical protein
MKDKHNDGLNNMLMIKLNGPPFELFQPQYAVDHWYCASKIICHMKRHVPFSRMLECARKIIAKLRLWQLQNRGDVHKFHIRFYIYTCKVLSGKPVVNYCVGK